MSEAAARARRSAIGFHGGGVLSLRLSDTQLTELREALRRPADDRWYEVEATDGAVLVDLAQVAYLRVESDEHRIGF